MKLIKYPPQSQWAKKLTRPSHNQEEIEQKIILILQNVKNRGDKAVKKYTLDFDKVKIKKLEVSAEEIDTAEKLVSQELKDAIHLAKRNIETFHNAQKEGLISIQTMPGVECRQKSVPISKVGLYIPGGSAPLFSTVLMLGIPASIAGCEQKIMCTPANSSGAVHPVILYTARLVGIDKIFKVGGAQAIAAMGYGTESIPKVYKIFGPGNQYVTRAKQMLNKEGIAIDMPAGPSELAVYADESCVPAFVAADLLSQAEHGPDSQVILVTTHIKIAESVQLELKKQLSLLPRKAIATKALENSKCFVLNNQEEAIQLINEYAPEHLILAIIDNEAVAERIINAGSIFLGNYTPESAGDYASGTNHTLPTYGFAKAYSGVSLNSFYKKITFQKITREGLAALGPSVEIMAEAEGLYAHKNAISIRLKK